MQQQRHTHKPSLHFDDFLITANMIKMQLKQSTKTYTRHTNTQTIESVQVACSIFLSAVDNNEGMLKFEKIPLEHNITREPS